MGGTYGSTVSFETFIPLQLFVDEVGVSARYDRRGIGTRLARRYRRDWPDPGVGRAADLGPPLHMVAPKGGGRWR